MWLCAYINYFISFLAVSSLSKEQKEVLSKFLSKYKKAIPKDKTQVESDVDSDLSDHEDFYLPGEDHHVKMEVSATRKAAIKCLFILTR
ncbi:hypothetical protein EB796_017811 [Bugula neritina]|uniref:Uncharacterized protein n=1 Tax=Bugula neritina TaxID=10212 RepID=A0A7J7JCG1_BUGNE|nr:hypothetical protein EB796_017811 [Bugula neritina]